MKFNEYLDKDIFKKLQEFFIKYPNPKDKQIHKFAEDLDIDTHQFEEIIYNLIGSFFSSGKSINYKGEYNQKELEMGVEIEMEHTTNKFIAEKITKDHLSEIKDYYSRLIKMEKEAHEEV